MGCEPPTKKKTPTPKKTQEIQSQTPEKKKASLLDIPEEEKREYDPDKFTVNPPLDDSIITFSNFQTKKPVTWEWTPPKTLLFTCNYVIPNDNPDKNASFSIRQFPSGEEGHLNDNLKRWTSLFRTNDGGPIKPEISTITAHKKDATLIQFNGEYMGAGGTWHSRDYQLVIVILEEPTETFFFKILGPLETVKESMEDLHSLLEQLESTPTVD
jgi:hypothetical protein